MKAAPPVDAQWLSRSASQYRRPYLNKISTLLRLAAYSAPLTSPVIVSVVLVKGVEPQDEHGSAEEEVAEQLRRHGDCVVCVWLDLKFNSLSASDKLIRIGGQAAM